MKSQVHIGIIGLGKRGMATLERYRYHSSAVFVALCDQNSNSCQAARELLDKQGRPEAKQMSLDEMCMSPNIDLIYICTNWDSHASLAIKALENDKDVALEIPAATTLVDCQRLGEAEKNSKGRVFLLENCCFDPFHLGMIGIAKEGLLGKITHLEGAYIHYLEEEAAVGYWGNPYPTHGIGPLSQFIKDDRFTSICSMNSCNHQNHSLLHTEKGRTITLQFDETTPRPYSRMQTVCGTKGFIQKYPLPTVQIENDVYAGNHAVDYVAKFIDDKYKSYIEKGNQLYVPNIMNYIMDSSLIDAVLQNTAYDITLNEALVWSSVIELSALSAQNGGELMYFP